MYLQDTAGFLTHCNKREHTRLGSLSNSKRAPKILSRLAELEDGIGGPFEDALGWAGEEVEMVSLSRQGL